MKSPDIFGQAVLDYFHQQSPEDIVVLSDDFDDDIIPVDYLFRAYQEMPKLEQKALRLAEGKILDVGCCAGSHALYLQEKQKNIKAIDVSPGAVEVARLRGIKQVELQDFFNLKNQQFDTILMLMNGSGIIGKLKNLTSFFKHLKTILAPNGKVLLDSSDLQYLFETDEDGGIWVNPNQYYGELAYKIQYKNQQSEKFDWLYIDFNSLKLAAESNGFSCILIQEGDHYDYLAMLKIS